MNDDNISSFLSRNYVVMATLRLQYYYSIIVDSSLLCRDLLHVMYLLQRLSPSILSRADFNFASLINDLSDLSSQDTPLSSIREQALSIVLAAPLDSLRNLISTGYL